MFGGLRVSGPKTNVDRFPTRRSALLLARVALSRSGSLGRDELASALWPDDYLDATRRRLRQELNRLRETLGPDAAFLASDRSWVQLDLEAIEIDAREFDRLIRAAQAEADPTTKSELRSRALGLYSGPLLPEQTEDWVGAERQEYQSKYLAALVEQTEDLIAQGNHRDALASALRAVRADPFHEPARIAAIRAFEGLGDIGAAIRQYAEYEKLLIREFSAQPSTALRQYIAELGVGMASIVSVPTLPPGPSAESPAPDRQTSLPTFLEGMVGREDELNLLTDWLSSSPPVRLVVVTGPGGVGKTRLAVAVAESNAAEFDGQVFYVGLAELDAGQSVTAKIQEAFGMSGAETASELLPHWGAKPCLLVMDNVEHVIEDARRAVKEILLTYPGVCVLATSRQKLGFRGEQELPLAPLAVPSPTGEEGALDDSPAAQLFLDRARAILPGYSLAEDQVDSFVMLLERLDGLPLAIELSAARIAFMSPEQMLEEIDDRFTFLVNRRSDVEPRQRSLRATIEWSFQGLDERLKDMLCTVGVFRGGCTLAFLRSATKGSDTIDLIQDLVEKSLIQSEEGAQGVRFTLLESIRHYVLDATPAWRVAELRTLHAELVVDYIYDYSRHLGRSESAEVYDAMRLELDNARVAFDWALEHRIEIAAKAGAALWRFWCARGRPAEGAHYLDLLLAKEPEVPSNYWAESLVGRGAIASIMGRHREACKWFEQAAATYRKVGNEYGIWWAHANLGFAMVEIGQNEAAIKLIDAELKKVGDPYERLAMLNVRARALPRMGRCEEAMSDAEEMLAHWIRDKNPLLRGRAFHQLADTYASCGKYESVQGLLAQALEQLRESQVQDITLRCMLSIAREELRLGNLESYLVAAEEANSLASSLGDSKVLGLLGALEGRRLARSGGSAAEVARSYENALFAAGESDRLTDLLDTSVMAAHDLACVGEQDAALTILAGVDGLRRASRCDLAHGELNERVATIEMVGPVEPNLAISDCKKLADLAMTTTARIR